MTQRERDRLVALNKADKKFLKELTTLIKQKKSL